MNLFKKQIGSLLVLVAGLLAGGAASATPITMNFDGLQFGSSVQNYYDGGCTTFSGIKLDCHGQDYGVVWEGATFVRSAHAPSPFNFAGFLRRDSATMNIAAGFDGGLSFYYYNASNGFFSGGVSVYSGLNGNGTSLSSMSLGQNGGWNLFDLAFSGIARSVVFNASSVFVTGVDDVTLGVKAIATPVPEPSALGVFGLGVLLMGLFAGLRRRCD